VFGNSVLPEQMQRCFSHGIIAFAIMYLSLDKKQVDSSSLFPHGLCEIILLAEN
jgi:hypothetical protein